ncbi:MAG: hypothetical protein FWD68_03150, partial [Alphaproteobacteria bacterium]|nr:hypothetical protein [Alphaproteobacteria bacterium]
MNLLAFSLLDDAAAAMCNLLRLRRQSANPEIHMEPISISTRDAANALGIGRSSVYILIQS